MPTLRVVGQIDESHQLHAAVPDSVRPGPVEIVVIVPADYEDEAAWMGGVAHEWREELSDPREEIYTLSDGESVDESR